MRDEHLTDEGAYVACALLRALCARPGAPRVGVNWYRVGQGAPDRPTAGHRHLSDRTRWAAVDPPLLDRLAELHRRAATTGLRVADVERAGLLPPGTIHFSDPVPEDRASRAVWHRRAVQHLAPAEVVFLDPDDGLEMPVLPISARQDRRTVALDGEIADHLARGQSVICRQRKPPASWPQIMGTLRPRLASLPGAPPPAAVKFGDRAYLLLAPDADALERLLAAARRLLARVAEAGWAELPMAVHDGGVLGLAQAPPAREGDSDVEAAIAEDPHLAESDRLLLSDLYRRLRLPEGPSGA